MDTNSQVERKKQKIAGLVAQKKSCAFLRVLAQNLGFLAQNLGFLARSCAVLSGCET